MMTRAKRATPSATHDIKNNLKLRAKHNETKQCSFGEENISYRQQQNNNNNKDVSTSSKRQRAAAMAAGADQEQA